MGNCSATRRPVQEFESSATEKNSTQYIVVSGHDNVARFLQDTSESRRGKGRYSDQVLWSTTNKKKNVRART